MVGAHKTHRSLFSDLNLRHLFWPVGAIYFLIPTFALATGQISAFHGRMFDALLNYSAGFVRRGLMGEFVALLGGSSVEARLLLSQILFASATLAVVVLVDGIIKNTSKPLAFFLILTSPAVFLASVNTNLAFRKEVFLFLLVATFLYATQEKSPFRRPELILILGFPIIVLIHEGLFFTAGLVSLALALFSRDRGLPLSASWRNIAVMLGLGGLAFLASFLNRDLAEATNRLCREFRSEGFIDAYCNQAEFLLGDLSAAWGLVADALANGDYLRIFSTTVFLAALPFTMIVMSKRMFLLFGLACLPMGALFFIGLDWGRWIVIASTLLALILLRFEGREDLRLRSEFQTASPRWLPFAISYLLLWGVQSNNVLGLHPGLMGEVMQHLFGVTVGL